MRQDVSQPYVKDGGEGQLASWGLLCSSTFHFMPLHHIHPYPPIYELFLQHRLLLSEFNSLQSEGKCPKREILLLSLSSPLCISDLTYSLPQKGVEKDREGDSILLFSTRPVSSLAF